MSDRAESDDWDEPLPLIRHLTELRRRLLNALGAVLAIFLCLIGFANTIYEFVSAPLRRLLPEGATMIATEVASPFLTPFKLVLMVSVFLAIPVILHQAWSYVSPGTYLRERRFAGPLLLASVVLFYLGVAFAYFVVLPLVFSFFTAVAPEGVTVMTDINQYLGFVLKLFFAFGFAFEIPVAAMLSVWSGLTTPERLRRIRPHVIVGCFVLGMFLTPPDAISQTLLALPMWLLYELGIFMSSRVVRARAADEAAAT